MAEETTPDKERDLALTQGEAYTAALEYEKSQANSVETETGDYIITVLSRRVEGWYSKQPEGDLQWEIPHPDHDLHLEVVVRDKEDLRFIPELKIYCKIYDSEENSMGDQSEDFTWDPYFYHYGANWYIPGEGDYIVEVTIREPLFDRHDQKLGKRYQNPVTVRMKPIKLIPGRAG